LSKGASVVGQKLLHPLRVAAFDHAGRAQGPLPIHGLVAQQVTPERLLMPHLSLGGDAEPLGGAPMGLHLDFGHGEPPRPAAPPMAAATAAPSRWIGRSRRTWRWTSGQGRCWAWGPESGSSAALPGGAAAPPGRARSTVPPAGRASS